jgi:hypothetical protein
VPRGPPCCKLFGRRGDGDPNAEIRTISISKYKFLQSASRSYSVFICLHQTIVGKTITTVGIYPIITNCRVSVPLKTQSGFHLKSDYIRSDLGPCCSNELVNASYLPLKLHLPGMPQLQLFDHQPTSKAISQDCRWPLFLYSLSDLVPFCPF